MRLVPVLVLALGFSGVAIAQETGLEDLVGARAGQAEAAVSARGYVWVKTETGDDRKWAYWWNASRGVCVTIATMQGRYTSIMASPAPDCGHATTPPAVSGGTTTAVDLALICFGDGQHAIAATHGGYRWNEKTKRYEYGDRTQVETEHVDTSIMLRLTGSTGQVRLPKPLIPPLNSGGHDQWWNLSDVVVSPDRIDARYKVNGLNQPKLTVDRRSGRITVKGAGDYAFNGSCDRVEQTGGNRF